ncbi:Gfo/Idh/MocA family protein [Pedobacter sp. ISL-64]|uniref:Gfo/Idh/MocA family protein n=1 Tax=Pedobacter sp. ISL-64 TaxID=2819164 RepID=UPI001BE4FE33|nr:Gfo/Idh/MocA family oxidoreductase [Pedobacter sp. ISL-64]MBT2562757.1 Gfo/Idh/MocA family oxidoreductase [Pedobacter sp. ISL-64]
MKKPLNIAIIGCSAIADKTVLPTIIENPLFNLVMVGSRSVEKGKQFAAKYKCDFGSYDDVLNSSRVDAVYVSVPTGLHYEWGMRVLQAKKHLLLEKPFTSTLEQSQSLINIAAQFNLIAMEGLAYVYHPYFEKLKELINQKIIGDIRLFESSFGFPSLPLTDIRNQNEIGGGAILDNLIYPLSASLEIFGKKYTNKSYYFQNNEELQIDERGFLRLDWANYSANLTYGFGFSYKNRIEIWGSEGTIIVDRAYTKPANMTAEIVIKTDKGTEIVEIRAVNQFHLMLDGFYHKISGEDPSFKNEKDDILMRMEIISEMYKASQNLNHE